MMDDQDRVASERRAQAAQWFARLKSLPVSRGTLDAFFQWRRDPANAEAFAETEKTWGDAGRIGTRPAMMRLADTALAKGSKHGGRRFFRPAASLAAAALVALLLLATWRLFEPRPTIDVATAVGERRTLALPDGSHLEVNTDTRVEAVLGARERRVRLDRGEVLFTVATDRSRPFIVAVGDIEVRATGTRFDVRHVEGQTRVALIEGGVDIDRAGQRLTQLRPGEQWRSDMPAGMTVRPIDTASAAAWTEGRILFDATPLDQAVDEVNRYSRAKLVLAATDRAADPVSGSFRAGDPEAFAKAASAMLGLEVDRGQDGALTLRQPPPRQD